MKLFISVLNSVFLLLIVILLFKIDSKTPEYYNVEKLKEIYAIESDSLRNKELNKIPYHKVTVENTVDTESYIINPELDVNITNDEIEVRGEVYAY